MNIQDLNKYLIRVQNALEECYEAQANYTSIPEEIYYLAEELIQEHGIGAVKVETARGRLAWFCLQDLVF
jgi:hypothetical protein